MGLIFGPDDGEIVAKDVSDDYKRMVPHPTDVRELPYTDNVVRTFDEPRKAYKYFRNDCYATLIIPADTKVVYARGKIRVDEAYVADITTVYHFKDDKQYGVAPYSTVEYHEDTWYKVAGGVDETVWTECDTEGIYVHQSKDTVKRHAR